MRGGHEGAHPGHVLLPQRGHQVQHPLVLGQHVPDPGQGVGYAVEHPGGPGRQVAAPVEHLRVQLPQGPDPQRGGGRLTGAAPPFVLAVTQGVVDPGVHDEELVVGQGPGHGDDGAVARVEQQQVLVDRAEGDGLVHPAGRGAGDLVLGPDARVHQVVHGQVGKAGHEVAKRETDRAGQRRRGGQARPEGDVPVDEDVHADLGRPGALRQHGRHAGDVGRPPVGTPLPDRGDGALPAVRGLQRGQPKEPVVPTSDGGVGPVRQGQRQRVAAVVVGVLPDEVDPPRGCPDPVWQVAEAAEELRGQGVGDVRVHGGREPGQGSGPARGPGAHRASTTRSRWACSGCSGTIGRPTSTRTFPGRTTPVPAHGTMGRASSRPSPPGSGTVTR